MCSLSHLENDHTITMTIVHLDAPIGRTSNNTNMNIAILSVYDKTGLLDLVKGLIQQNVRILASGGTARMIREAGFPVE